MIVYQEELHTMRTKQGKKAFMIFKIDLEKAYDRLSWSFISETLQLVGFNHEWVRNNMGCVETTRLSVMWNDDKLEWIKPSRGVRQGDTISPYIFILCIERLSHMIIDAINKGHWKGIKTSKHDIIFTHFFFLANDMVLFFEASQEQISIVKECPDTFCAASGQKVSGHKTQFFSLPTPMREKPRRLRT